MPDLPIDDVPLEVIRTLRARAARAGLPLEEYLLARLIEDASRPTLAEVLARVGERSGGRVPLDFAVETLRRERLRSR